MAEENDANEDLIPHSARVFLAIAGMVMLVVIIALWQIHPNAT